MDGTKWEVLQYRLADIKKRVQNISDDYLKSAYRQDAQMILKS